MSTLATDTDTLYDGIAAQHGSGEVFMERIGTRRDG
jgi:hypothetical protein